MNILTLVMAFIVSLSLTAYGADKRQKYRVTGEHKVGSSGPLTNTIGCQIALDNALRLADEKCYSEGYDTYDTRGLSHGSCGQGPFGMWSETKSIEVSFYCK